MVCIYCSSPTQVANSRPQKRTNTTWRRRQCTSCKAIFTTEESALLEAAVAVIDSYGAIHAFKREKLLISLYNSLRHRSSALQDAVALTSTVIGEVLPRTQAASVPTFVIVQAATEVLDRFDQAAAVQYRAYHPLT